MANNPKYIQLANELEKLITSGTLKAGEKLLSENELCKAHNISRITVRQALNILERKNLIYTSHGKGTFVKMPDLSTHLPEVVPIGQKLLSQGIDGHTKINSFTKGIKNQQIANTLHLKDSTPLFRLRLTTIIENLPAASYDSYFEESLGEKIYAYAQELEKSKKAFTPFDVYNMLNLKLDHVDQTITAASTSVAPALTEDLPEDKAILVLSSIFFDESKRAIEYRTAFYRSDLYSFDITRTF